jgi:hypothetical protein
MAQDKLTGAARGGLSRTRAGQVSIILAGAVVVGGVLAEAAAPGCSEPTAVVTPPEAVPAA